MSARITELDVEVLPDPANPQLLVRVTDDTGATGCGETWWGTYQPDATPGTPVRPIASFLDHVLRPLCLAAPVDDPDDVHALWARMYRATYQYGPDGLVSTAIAGIDLALWDLVGRRLGRPVTELLGPAVHDAVPAYASLHWLGDADAACADARRAVDHGFAGIKLHEVEAEVILAVREEVGDEIAVMVDLSARLDEAGALALEQRLAGRGIGWLEEPVFPQQDHATLARIRQRSSIPIAAGENEFGVDGFRRLLDSGAIDVVQPDLAKCGGLSHAVAIADLAAERGVALCPHNFSLGPSLRANVHWAMSAAAATWIEVPWLPVGQTFPSGEVLPTLVGGRVVRPRGPGLAAT